MAQIKVLGSEARLRSIFCKQWPDVKVTGGHTTITFKPGTEQAVQARDIYASLVTLHAFTPLETTVPDAPTRAPKVMPEDITELTEYTLIPMYAGG